MGENTFGNPPVTVLLANTEKSVVEADYDRIVSMENSDTFLDIVPSEAPASLMSLRRGSRSSPDQNLPALAVVAMIAIAAVTAAVAAKSERNTSDGTEYLVIE